MERQHRLLLVEDEDGLRRLVSEFLRSSGFDVTEAVDGPSAVARFAESGPFDLALVDLNLPGFSGVEVCRRIHQAAPAQPIVICSAAILPDSEDALRRLRIDHFLTKPFHPDVLLAQIADRLGTGHGRPRSAPATAPVPAGRPAAPAVRSRGG